MVRRIEFQRQHEWRLYDLDTQIDTCVLYLTVHGYFSMALDFRLLGEFQWTI